VNALARLVLGAVRYPPEPADPAGSPGTLRVVSASPRYVAYRWTRRWLWLGVAIWMEEQFWGRALHDRGFVIFLAGLAVAGAIVDSFLLWVEYSVRSYKLTDRAMRLREGLFSVREMTMTITNVQNVSVSRGPLQGLFGISDVVIQSAGGGSASGLNKPIGVHALHTAHFRGLTNAEEVRDLVMAQLKRARDAGLGDREDAPQSASALETLLSEARALADTAVTVRIS
jgi:uncharacterized membrane protein YdbT with pleckstrin-like domain